jgi:zeta-carotene desaturase
MKIAIIGSGIAGISAVANLVNLPKVEITLFEATQKIGGRIFSFQEPVTKDFIDNGKHIMVGAYQNFFALLNQLGTYHFLEFQKYLNVKLISKDNCTIFKSGALGKFSQFISLLSMKNLSLKDKIALLNFIRNIPHIKSTNKTVAEMLLENGQSQNITTNFWEPITLATMNTKIEYASADIFLNILNKTFFSDKNSQKLVFSKIPLLELLNLNNIISKNNFKVLLSKKIEKISQTQDNNYMLFTKEEHFGNFDSVIFAIAPLHLFSILKNSQLQIENKIENLKKNLEKIKYSPIISLYLWSDNEFMKDNFSGMLGTEFHWIFKEKSRQNFLYTLTKSSAEDIVNRSKQEIIDIAYKDLQSIFKEFQANKIYYNRLIIEKQATVIISPEMQSKRQEQKLIKGIYIAGDWTTTDLPATIESAAFSGKKAADFLKYDFQM